MDDFVERSRNGDVEAYGRLVHEHQQEVWSVLAILLYDRATTEKLACEVFAEGFERIADFNPRYEFKGFIKGIARAKVREQLAAAREAKGKLLPYREHLEHIFAEDAQAAVYQRKVAAVLETCEARLNDATRQMIDLRYRESRNTDEIGKAVKRPAQTVAQAMQRALIGLRDCVIVEGSRS